MMMNAYSMLQKTPHPSRDKIVEEMDGLVPLRRASTDHRGDSGGGEMKPRHPLERHTLLPAGGEKVAEGRMRGFDRRTFCKLLGGGIVVLIVQPSALLGDAMTSDPNAYLRIDETGRVTLFSGKIEMGQGVHTSLAQMAAEELGVSLDSVSMSASEKFFSPKRLPTAFAVDFPAPPHIAREWFQNPEKRNLTMPTVHWTAGERPLGRGGVASNHGAHGGGPHRSHCGLASVRRFHNRCI